MPRRTRVEQQPRGLAAARRQHYRAAADLLFATRNFIYIGNGRNIAGVAGNQLSRHGVSDQLHAASLKSGEDLHLAGGVIRRRDASAPALPAIMARWTAIGRPGDDGEPHRDARNAELICRPLYKGLMNARRRASLENSVGRAANAFF